MAPRRFPDYRTRPSGAPLALEGLRVIDFTQMLSGPYCTQELADLGADVIKIEAPVRGDDSRHYTTTALAGECAFYLSTNRNKRSLTLDLKNKDGREVALRLIRDADIVIENFSNGVMERLGLDHSAVCCTNPALIYCSISGYGRDDRAEVSRRGYDAMFQAASGFMSLTGDPDRLPMRTTVPILDTACAMTATSAILAGIIARYRLGRGQFIEVALLDVAMSVLTLYGMSALVSGRDFGRSGNRAPQTAPSDAFETRTGPLFLTCGNNSLFRRMCVDALGRADIADRPDFATNAERVRHQQELTEILREIFLTDTRENWVRILNAVGVPAAPIATILEAMKSADVVTRDLVNEIAHPKAGRVPNVRSPYRMSVTPVADPIAAPLLGQHTEEIVRGVAGYSREEYVTLAEAGVFGPTDRMQA